MGQIMLGLDSWNFPKRVGWGGVSARFLSTFIELQSKSVSVWLPPGVALDFSLQPTPFVWFRVLTPHTPADVHDTSRGPL